jgi:hypothetical protein
MSAGRAMTCVLVRLGSGTGLAAQDGTGPGATGVILTTDVDALVRAGAAGDGPHRTPGHGVLVPRPERLGRAGGPPARVRGIVVP